MKHHLPNGLTISRGILTVAIILIFFTDIPGKYSILLFLFFLACATDFLDGYFARKWNVISEFGIVFDSLLDKILVISTLILLIPENVLPLWLIVAIIVRDLFIDGLKNYSLSKGQAIPAIKSGKWKFVFQVIMIHAVLFSLAFPKIQILEDAILISGLMALIFSYYSGFIYTKKFFQKKL